MNHVVGSELADSVGPLRHAVRPAGPASADPTVLDVGNAGQRRPLTSDSATTGNLGLLTRGGPLAGRAVSLMRLGMEAEA